MEIELTVKEFMELIGPVVKKVELDDVEQTENGMRWSSHLATPEIEDPGVPVRRGPSGPSQDAKDEDFSKQFLTEG
jgi:hypothetical protein